MKEKGKKIIDFPPVTRKDWEVAARDELDGADPWQKLVHNGEGWSIRPIYDPPEGGQPPPLLQDSKNNFLGPRAWYNCPRIPVQVAKIANKKALESLQQGADGVLFDLEGDTDFETLLDGIQWEYCSLNFLAKKNSDTIAKELFGFMNRKKKFNAQLHGAFFGDILVPGISHHSFRFSGIHAEPSESPIDELVSAFRSLSDAFKGDITTSGPGAALSLPLGENFFMEVSKLRAARKLWGMILEKTGSSSSPLYLHVRSATGKAEEFQPHGNMLRTTSAAVAAVLGGCDALTLLPEDANQPMLTRVATNISTILREECHLSKVADPVAGSWFVEDLTQQLAHEAWARLQKDLP